MQIDPNALTAILWLSIIALILLSLLALRLRAIKKEGARELQKINALYEAHKKPNQEARELCLEVPKLLAELRTKLDLELKDWEIWHRACLEYFMAYKLCGDLMAYLGRRTDIPDTRKDEEIIKEIHTHLIKAKSLCEELKTSFTSNILPGRHKSHLNSC